MLISEHIFSCRACPNLVIVTQKEGKIGTINFSFLLWFLENESDIYSFEDESEMNHISE